MPKKVEINAPKKDGRKTVIVKASGSVARIKVGDTVVKCIMQTEFDGRETFPTLVHFASGFVIIGANTISARKVREMATSTRSLTSRNAAQQCVDRLVKAQGADKILEVINAAKVIN